ncbi:hypothetical protein RHCRD62_60297 [Rhodococcus sp. RD6.2]|nr:hypothetical protein RHCRD62_60297 [Rhodococcus sp. RD6.2]
MWPRDRGRVNVAFAQLDYECTDAEPSGSTERLTGHTDSHPLGLCCKDTDCHHCLSRGGSAVKTRLAGKFAVRRQIGHHCHLSDQCVRLRARRRCG